jgi:hypothetical protein
MAVLGQGWERVFCTNLPDRGNGAGLPKIPRLRGRVRRCARRASRITVVPESPTTRETDMACEADCKIRKRKKGTRKGEVKPTAKNPDYPVEKFPKPAQYDPAFDKKIDEWMADKVLAPKCAAGCTCEATEEPDWDKKKTLSREFKMKFDANGYEWEVTATQEFKSAIVPGDCIEDADKPIDLGYAVSIPEDGITLLADGGKPTAKTLEKLRKAMG